MLCAPSIRAYSTRWASDTTRQPCPRCRPRLPPRLLPPLPPTTAPSQACAHRAAASIVLLKTDWAGAPRLARRPRLCWSRQDTGSGCRACAGRGRARCWGEQQGARCQLRCVTGCNHRTCHTATREQHTPRHTHAPGCAGNAAVCLCRCCCCSRWCWWRRHGCLTTRATPKRRLLLLIQASSGALCLPEPAPAVRCAAASVLKKAQQARLPCVLALLEQDQTLFPQRPGIGPCSSSNNDFMLLGQRW